MLSFRSLTRKLTAGLVLTAILFVTRTAAESAQCDAASLTSRSLKATLDLLEIKEAELASTVSRINSAVQEMELLTKKYHDQERQLANSVYLWDFNVLQQQYNQTVKELEKTFAKGVPPQQVKEENVEGVDRRSNLSFEDFYREYAIPGIPVIITDYMDKMNTTAWSMEHFRDSCNDEKVWIPKRVYGVQKWGGLDGGELMTVRDFVDNVKRNETMMTQSGLYVHDLPLPRWCPKVMPEFRVPKYFAQDYLQRIQHDHFMIQRAWPSLFVGPKGSSSALHVDSLASHFWMGLLEGRKRWRFFPHAHRPFLYEARHKKHFDFDALKPDFEKFPLAKYAHSFDCVLQPGEMLFVPAAMPHQVHNIDTTVAISMNYIDGSNFHLSLEELELLTASGFDGNKVMYDMMKDPKFHTYMNLQQGDMTYEEYRTQGLNPVFPPLPTASPSNHSQMVIEEIEVEVQPATPIFSTSS